MGNFIRQYSRFYFRFSARNKAAKRRQIYIENGQNARGKALPVIK